MDSLEQRRVDLIAKVRTTLIDAGVPAHGCAKALSTVLDVAIAQAYRKLSGVSVFTFPQIEAIEQEYGVQLLTVVQEPNTQQGKTSRSRINATLVVEGRNIPCEVTLGGARKAAGQRFVALLLKGQWYVYLADEYSGKEPLFDVATMHMVTSL
jgi:BetR domain